MAEAKSSRLDCVADYDRKDGFAASLRAPKQDCHQPARLNQRNLSGASNWSSLDLGVLGVVIVDRPTIPTCSTRMRWYLGLLLRLMRSSIEPRSGQRPDDPGAATQADYRVMQAHACASLWERHHAAAGRR